jgi:hypothetical protein
MAKRRGEPFNRRGARKMGAACDAITVACEKKRPAPRTKVAGTRRISVTAISDGDAERAARWATICELNPGGMTGDARRINKQKLAFEGQ